MVNRNDFPKIHNCIAITLLGLFAAFLNIPLINIHDSVLTTKEYAEEAENGLRATLKEGNYSINREF
jgi:hypothetical protein